MHCRINVEVIMLYCRLLIQTRMRMVLIAGAVPSILSLWTWDGVTSQLLPKQKKSAAILNDASWRTRSVQIVLFLKAVQQLVNKTVLILCPEGAEQKWLELFQNFTDFSNDVVVETEKYFIKKKVLINPCQNLSTFNGHSWGVLVVDGDMSTADIMKVPFKADYTIWSEPLNMKRNLQYFSQIYKWIYPKAKFNENDYLPNGKNLNEIVEKAIFLDAFMEDIVFSKYEGNDTIEEQINETEILKVSKKNKDATGTKVKRTKRKLNDNLLENLDNIVHNESVSKYKKQNTVENVENITNNYKETILSTNFDNSEANYSYDNEDLIVYKSKKSKKDIIEDFDSELLKSPQNIDATASSTQSELNLHYEDSDEMYEKDTQPLINVLQSPAKNITVNCIEFWENSDVPAIADGFTQCNIIDKDYKGIVKENESEFNEIGYTNDVNSTTTVDDAMDNEIKYENSTHEVIVPVKYNENDRIAPSKEPSKINAPAQNEIAITNNETLPTKEMKHEEKVNFSELQKNELQENELKDDKKPNGNKINTPAQNEIANTNHETLPSNVMKHEEKVNFSELQKNELQENEFKEDKKQNANELQKPVTNNTIDDKMKEIEEKAFNKFKGSILDSLF